MNKLCSDLPTYQHICDESINLVSEEMEVT